MDLTQKNCLHGNYSPRDVSGKGNHQYLGFLARNLWCVECLITAIYGNLKRAYFFSTEKKHLGKHKGENFDLALFDTLKQLKLTNYMVSITTDNASNNTTLAEKAEELISGTFQASNHLLEGMAHVIDLEAREGLGYFF